MAVRAPRMVLGHGWILVYSLIYLFSMHLNTVPLRVVPILLYDLRGAFVVNVHPMCSITTIEARLFIANIRYRSITLGLGLGRIKSEKKRPAQPEWPKQDREILRRCMSRSPYKPQAPPVWTRSPCYGRSPWPTNSGT